MIRKITIALIFLGLAGCIKRVPMPLPDGTVVVKKAELETALKQREELVANDQIHRDNAAALRRHIEVLRKDLAGCLNREPENLDRIPDHLNK